MVKKKIFIVIVLLLCLAFTCTMVVKSSYHTFDVMHNTCILLNLSVGFSNWTDGSSWIDGTIWLQIIFEKLPDTPFIGGDYEKLRTVFEKVAYLSWDNPYREEIQQELIELSYGYKTSFPYAVNVVEGDLNHILELLKLSETAK